MQRFFSSQFPKARGLLSRDVSAGGIGLLNRVHPLRLSGHACVGFKVPAVAVPERLSSLRAHRRAARLRLRLAQQGRSGPRAGASWTEVGPFLAILFIMLMLDRGRPDLFPLQVARDLPDLAAVHA
jgi:hypothetical protein